MNPFLPEGTILPDSNVGRPDSSVAREAAEAAHDALDDPHAIGSGEHNPDYVHVKGETFMERQMRVFGRVMS